jgi:hypothetical protein
MQIIREVSDKFGILFLEKLFPTQIRGFSLYSLS